MTAPTGKAYTGDGITVYYDGKRCRHFAECLRALPTVFNAHERPWIQPAGASVADVVSAVELCPSGALHYERDDGVAEVSDGLTTVEVRSDGPVMVRGDFIVQTADGPVRETRAAVCGCARTSNAPFCDGTCGCKP